MTPQDKQIALDILRKRTDEQREQLASVDSRLVEYYDGLVTYYDKASARVTDDLYNLGLTARKQAVKVEDPGKVDDEDPMKKFYQDARK